MITIKELAEILNLSTTTVSNVIHGKTKEVSKATIERVQEALTKYEYVPNISASNLARNKSKIIGVALLARPDKYPNLLTDPFISELVSSHHGTRTASFSSGLWAVPGKKWVSGIKSPLSRSTVLM